MQGLGANFPPRQISRDGKANIEIIFLTGVAAPQIIIIMENQNTLNCPLVSIMLKHKIPQITYVQSKENLNEIRLDSHLNESYGNVMGGQAFSDSQNLNTSTCGNYGLMKQRRFLRPTSEITFFDEVFMVKGADKKGLADFIEKELNTYKSFFDFNYSSHKYRV